MDRLTAQQVAEVLAAPCAAMEAARQATFQALPPGKRVLLPGLALLHAYEATHGIGCALSTLRPGPLPNVERDDAMLQIYRKIAGDTMTNDQTLIDQSLKLYKRRFSGGKAPSPSLRKWFSALSLVRREGLVFCPGGAERLVAVQTDELTVLRRCPDMDVSGLHVGDEVLTQGLEPGTLALKWFRARITGFTFRCLMPPIHIEFFASEDGDTLTSLPNPRDGVCRKKDVKPLPDGDVFETTKRSKAVDIL